jgi:hypothetical protein
MRCRVITTDHSSVQPGDEGEIIGQAFEGWEVRFTGIHNPINNAKEDRILYMPANTVQILQFSKPE